jgi:hypothetical protein
LDHFFNEKQPHAEHSCNKVNMHICPQQLQWNDKKKPFRLFFSVFKKQKEKQGEKEKTENLRSHFSADSEYPKSPDRKKRGCIHRLCWLMKKYE